MRSGLFKVVFSLLPLFMMAAVSGADPVLVIASQSPLSGDQSGLGRAIARGAELAVRDFGKVLSAKGFRLEFRALDDRSDASTGVENAKALVADPNVLAVVGHLNSGVALPAGEVYERANLAVVSPANTHQLLTARGFRTFNRIVGRDDVQGPLMARFMVGQAGWKRIAVVDDGTPYGRGLAQGFAGELVTLDSSAVLQVSLQGSSVGKLAERIKTVRPDAVFFAGLYPQAGVLLRALRAAGVQSAFCGGDGLDAQGLEVAAGRELLRGVTFITTAAPVGQFPAGRRFALEYQKVFKEAPESYAMYGYDAAHVAIQAMASAIKAPGQRPSRLEVTQAARRVVLSGVTGRIAFDANGDLELARYFVVRLNTGFQDSSVVKVVTVRSTQKR